MTNTTDVKKNGCFNRKPYKDTVLVQDGWRDYKSMGTQSREIIMREVPFTMTQECNYTHSAIGQQDKGCDGCKWRQEQPNPAMSC